MNTTYDVFVRYDRYYYKRTASALSVMAWLRKWGVLYVVCVILLAGGFWLILHPYLEVTKSLGDALFIAGILLLPVDYFVKKHLAKEASEDISKFIWGYGLPSQIVSKAWNSIKANSTVRENTRLHYVLTSNPEQGDRIRLNVRVEWELENLTNRTETYQQKQDFYEFYESILNEAWFTDCASPKNRYHLLTPEVKPIELGRVFVGKKRLLRPHQTGESQSNGSQVYKSGVSYTTVYASEYIDYFFFGGVANRRYHYGGMAR